MAGRHRAVRAGLGRGRGVRRAGATFVEIAIATLFLALAMVPLLDSILSSSARVREDRARVFATSLAASTMERYRLVWPDRCAAAAADAETNELVNPVSAPAAAPTALDTWQQYRNGFAIDVTCPEVDQKAVLTVRVTWNEGAHARSVQMRSLLAPTNHSGAPP